jgi:hypothetical protein
MSYLVICSRHHWRPMENKVMTLIQSSRQKKWVTLSRGAIEFQ